jgi:hypothetical protein
MPGVLLDNTIDAATIVIENRLHLRLMFTAHGQDRNAMFRRRRSRDDSSLAQESIWCGKFL